MPFPNSPFTECFNSHLITGLNEENSDTTISNEDYEKTTKWLCSSPKITSFRVNTLKTTTEEVLNTVQKYIEQILGETSIKAEIYHLIPNVIIVHNRNMTGTLERLYTEIVVDVDCAAAILRGAHIFAPGVLGMMSGTHLNDKVSVYADVSKNCKKGLQKLYEDKNKIFIANGITKLTRHELYGENLNPSGIAIEITESISGCLPLNENILPLGWALLQNIPSIYCVQVLNPQPNEKILDMCASPGNKTTHIAEMMQNKGVLVAIDKTPKKITQLKKRCQDFNIKAHIFEADSSKIVCSDFKLTKNIEDGPPFLTETFDKILLDAPCSALGKRPQLVNRLSDKMIKSYVPLQRRLFESAVQLLKVNGTLVYSTCTITLSENEGMVAWALKTFKCLELLRPIDCLGGPGWTGSSLTGEERNKVQRFGPDVEGVDSVGFFLAIFVKKSSK